MKFILVALGVWIFVWILIRSTPSNVITSSRCSSEAYITEYFGTCNKPHLYPEDESYTLHGVHEPVNNKQWEYNEQKTLLKYVKDGDRVLQLGGNIGASCITLSRSRHLERNTCVEPNDKIIPILKKNVAQHAKHVEIIHGIITGSSHPQYLDYGDGPNMWGGNTLKNNDKGQPVRQISLHRLEQHRTPYNILFADCEGCLPAFLREYPNHKWDAIIYEPDQGVDYSIVEEIAKNNGLQEGPSEPGVIAWVSPRGSDPARRDA